MMKRLALLASLTLALACTVAAAAPMPDTEPAYTEAAMVAAPAAQDVAANDVVVLQYRQAECVITSVPIATVPSPNSTGFSPTPTQAPVEVRLTTGRPALSIA